MAAIAAPPGALQTGTDAMLLAAWAVHCLQPARHKWLAKYGQLMLAELGCGLGGALFTAAIEENQAYFSGFEKEFALVEAARQTAAALGLADRMQFDQADITAFARIGPPRFQLVMANPPWRLSGQPCGNELRQSAIYGDPLTTEIFCRAAARLLIWHGFFCLLTIPERLTAACAALDRTHLGLRRLLPVYSFEGRKASRLLVLAQKDAASDCSMAAPLILHEKTGGKVSWTKKALEFSPWLAQSPWGSSW